MKCIIQTSHKAGDSTRDIQYCGINVVMKMVQNINGNEEETDRNIYEKLTTSDNQLLQRNLNPVSVYASPIKHILKKVTTMGLMHRHEIIVSQP